MTTKSEGETPITSDETRGNKRLSPPRTRIISRRARYCVPLSSLSLSLSITFVLFSNAKRDYIWRTRRNGVIHFRRNTTALFDGAIFHVHSIVRYCIYISWWSFFPVVFSIIKRIIPCRLFSEIMPATYQILIESTFKEVNKSKFLEK